MPNIVSPVAIKFSNERIRVSSDLMAQSYYPAVAAADRWISLGSGQAALDQMQNDIRDCSNKFLAAYDHLYWTEKN